MTTFLLTLTISFVLVLTFGSIISYCKRRQSTTSHGLTGMCHETGGTMCSCCSSRLLANRDTSARQQNCRVKDLPPITRND